MLSVVIPAYNEEVMISQTSKTICEILTAGDIEFELLFVNDGSKDQTWKKICAEAEKDVRIRGINFSRNFGKESAMFAGLENAIGDCVVVIDCDLQHPPKKIVEMYRLWEQGYEIVEGVKKSRGNESGVHSLAAKCFYGLISNATGIDMSHSSDFKLLDRKAVNVLINMPEKNAFFRALSSWIGFKSIQIEYDVQERVAGTSKWSVMSLIKYAFTNITSFTSVPMYAVTLLGGIMLLITVVLGIFAVYKKIAGMAVEGFTTVIILLCFIGSTMMISLGIIGYYIAKIYEEIKGRPRYIISETIGHTK